MLTPIRKNADYKRIAQQGKRCALPAFLIQVVKTTDSDPLRVGLTVSRKVGKAVTRNRAKRRLREVARLVCRERSLAGAEVVLIARTEAVHRDFSVMKQDFLKGLQILGVLV